MKIFFYLLIALSIWTGRADAQNDPAAKKVLDMVSAKLKTYKGITADFALVSKGRSGKINNNVHGRVFIKGNKYFIKQGATEIFSDGSKTWNYNGSDEVTVTTVDADAQTLSPQKLLTNFYDKDFTYKQVSAAGKYDEIAMTPTDKRKNFKQVNIFVDKAKLIVTKAKVRDKSNNNIEFSLTKINTASSIPDSKFVFDKSKYAKNIEVIE